MPSNQLLLHLQVDNTVKTAQAHQVVHCPMNVALSMCGPSKHKRCACCSAQGSVHKAHSRLQESISASIIAHRWCTVPLNLCLHSGSQSPTLSLLQQLHITPSTKTQCVPECNARCAVHCLTQKKKGQRVPTTTGTSPPDCTSATVQARLSSLAHASQQ